MRRNGGLLLGVAAAALALTGAAVAAVVMHHGTARIAVSLREYKITTTRAAKAGKTTFVVTNRGKLVHSFEISGPGIGKRRLSGTIAPGKTRTLTVTLKGGTYRVWCPIPGHAALGMRTTLHVGGGSTGGSGGGATTGGTSTGGGGTSWG